jgi:hypothetical protein
VDRGADTPLAILPERFGRHSERCRNSQQHGVVHRCIRTSEESTDVRWIDAGSRGEIALRTPAFVQQLRHADPERRYGAVRVLVTSGTEHWRKDASNGFG